MHIDVADKSNFKKPGKQKMPGLKSKKQEVPYSAKFWWDKTLANRSFQSFGEEYVGEFTIANVSYLSESQIWLGKILANDVCFAKFAKVFPSLNFCTIRYSEMR